MTVVYDRWGVQVHHGDCLNVMQEFPDCSVDSVVTDPPAGIAFMGRSWDSDRGGRDRWVEWLAVRMEQALRVLKPGGHALVWALPRTSHWTALALEDSGFEIRDCVTHLFGTGFPKSLDISKAIDRAAGAEREVTGTEPDRWTNKGAVLNFATDRAQSVVPIHGPAVTDAARQWSGWGTALKPAGEHWWLVRKPFRGSIAGCVLEHGTGALNIAECRVPAPGELIANHARGPVTAVSKGIYGDSAAQETHQTGGQLIGRWPSNVVLSHGALLDPESGEVAGDACTDGCFAGCAVAELDRQSGYQCDGVAVNRNRSGNSYQAPSCYGEYGTKAGPDVGYGGGGGASRFFPVFRWESKAPPAERPRVNGTAHPTVKSVALMRWLVRLVTPPGGMVLDCFAGTGTTGQAARAEGFRSVLIEEDSENLPFIRARLDALPKTEVSADGVKVVVDEGPVDLFGLLAAETEPVS